MPKTNPVEQILVTSGNAHILAKGKQVTDLAIGQIGLFSYPSGISVDSTSTIELADKFYLAVGVDPLGTGSLADISKSAGEYIKLRKVVGIDARCYSPAQAKIQKLKDVSGTLGLNAKCDTEYGLKLIITNPAAYPTYGFNTPLFSFVVRTSACPSDCTGGACDAAGNEMVNLMVQEINSDPNGLFTAAMIDPNNSDAVVTSSGYAAWVAANPGKYLGIKVTTSAVALQTYSNVNLKYDFPRMTDVNMTVFEGFDSLATVTTAQDLAYEQGAGYDVAHWEEFAAGWNGRIDKNAGTYRVSQIAGVALGVTTYASKTGKYLTVAISNYLDEHNEDVVTEQQNRTVIAIPCGETNTIGDVMTLLDTIFANQFRPLSAYTSACPSCTTVNTIDGGTAGVDGETQGDAERA
jgi:hypothetical protein